MGLFSSSKSSSTQNTSLADNRLVTDANSLGNTGAGGAVGGLLGVTGGPGYLTDASQIDNSVALSSVNSDSRQWSDSRRWSDSSQNSTSINITDGGIIKSAFDYLSARDASGAKQVDALLNTAASSVSAAMSNTKTAESKANDTMIYALAAVAAVLIFKMG